MQQENPLAELLAESLDGCNGELMSIRLSSVSTHTHRPVHAACVPQACGYPWQPRPLAGAYGTFGSDALRFHSSHDAHMSTTASAAAPLLLAITAMISA